MKFDNLSLSEPLLRSIVAAGYEETTDIQEKAIPEILAGHDLVGCAQTGTGKTAAFALPTLQQLLSSAEATSGAEQRRKRSGRRAIRGLILAPTRELAGQICDSLVTYGKFTHLRHTAIFGGVRQGPQVRALQAGVDILVATPGRLLDLVQQGFVDLAAVEILILDEADQMLDMGFIHDLKKIVSKVPAERQTLMFSATMPPEIRKLASQWLRRPVEVKAAAVASTPARVSQAVYFVEKHQKAATLTKFLQGTNSSKTLVFSRTRRGADKIARGLERDGIRAVAIHGDKSQAKRDAVIRQFKSKRPPVLVATDLASRGLDFSDITHVINYDMPDAPETYVHRIGRTARAGAAGQAISFCDRDERVRLRRIERLTGQAVTVEKIPGMTHSPAPEVPHSKVHETVAKIGYNEKRGGGHKASHNNASPGNRPSRSKRRAERMAKSTHAAAANSSTGARRRKPNKSSSNRKHTQHSIAGSSSVAGSS